MALSFAYAKDADVGNDGCDLQVTTQRTSVNAFDTTSEVAMKLKRRCFELLGIRCVLMEDYRSHCHLQALSVSPLNNPILVAGLTMRPGLMAYRF